MDSANRSCELKYRSTCGLISFLLLLPVSSWAGSPFEGFYFGTTSQACENGEFGVAVRADNTAIVIGFDDYDGNGRVLTDVVVEPNGNFLIENFDGLGTEVAGTISGNGISGTLDSPSCEGLGYFTGTKSTCGDLGGVSGLYSGATSGTVVVENIGSDHVAGEMDLLIAPDGQTMSYGYVYSDAFGAGAHDGGMLSLTSLGSTGTVSGTFLRGTSIVGSLDFAAGSGGGSASFYGEIGDSGHTGSVLGTWDVNRTETIGCPEPSPSTLACAAMASLVSVARIRFRLTGERACTRKIAATVRLLPVNFVGRS